MRTIRLSAFVAALVRQHAEAAGYGWDPTGSVVNPDGTWSVAVDDELLVVLELIDPDPEVAIRRALGVPGSQAGRA